MIGKWMNAKKARHYYVRGRAICGSKEKPDQRVSHATPCWKCIITSIRGAK